MKHPTSKYAIGDYVYMTRLIKLCCGRSLTTGLGVTVYDVKNTGNKSRPEWRYLVGTYIGEARGWVYKDDISAVKPQD